MTSHSASPMLAVPTHGYSSAFGQPRLKTSPTVAPTKWSLRHHRPTADSERLWKTLHHSAQWGAIPGSQGMARLALSDEDQCVRDYFVTEASKIGCVVKVDEVGNIFAILPGRDNTIPPTGVGSHLDTQPAGGRYDGILGVLAGLEICRAIKASGYQTFAPIAAINWTNEEGARFTPGCSGSAAWAGHTPVSQIHDTRETLGNGCTLKQELERIGYLGDVEANYAANPLSGHFELHIEQRRLLQDAQKAIGVVTNIQGIRWYRVTVVGCRAHAGSTPMDQRTDAMVATSKLIVFVDGAARKASAVATAGVVTLDKPSSNTIPGRVSFTLDLRHRSERAIDEIEESMRAFAASLMADDERLSIDMARIWRSPAVELNENAVSCVRKAARELTGEFAMMETVSLAGHDSALTATRVPTAMIFVPSKDGISHAPEEFTSKEECAIGLQVLLRAVLEYDDYLERTTVPGTPF